MADATGVAATGPAARRVRKAAMRCGGSAAVLIVAFACYSCHKGDFAKVKKKPRPTSVPMTDGGSLLGRDISFGTPGHSEILRQSGWQPTEPQFTWTEGHLATLRFTNLPSDTPLTLHMWLTPALAIPRLVSQPVTVRANKREVAHWEVDSEQDYDAIIPVNALRADGDLTIELELPKAFAPKERGLSGDARVFGVACYSVRIDRLAARH